MNGDSIFLIATWVGDLHLRVPFPFSSGPVRNRVCRREVLFWCSPGGRWMQWNSGHCAPTMPLQEGPKALSVLLISTLLADSEAVLEAVLDTCQGPSLFGYVLRTRL
jgi:hypothetical protein